MTRRFGAVLFLTLMVSATLALAQSTNISLAGMQLAYSRGFEAKVSALPGADNGATATLVAFTKAGEERRLLALGAPVTASLSSAKALSLRYRLSMETGNAPRLCLMLFAGDGAWYRTSNAPLTAGGFAEARLALSSMRPAAFSSDQAANPPLDKIDRAWIGFLFDGSARGSVAVSAARFTDEPYKPTSPLPVNLLGANRWEIGKDPAVTASVTMPAEGPGGVPCYRLDAKFPVGPHMFCTPALSLAGLELDGYSGLRITYKAKLPGNINGLLLMLIEQSGASYYADPAPAATAEWRTVTLPLSSFKLGGWSKDDNNRLDLTQLTRLTLGVHGQARGDGTIEVLVSQVEFVP